MAIWSRWTKSLRLSSSKRYQNLLATSCKPVRCLRLQVPSNLMSLRMMGTMLRGRVWIVTGPSGWDNQC